MISQVQSQKFLQQPTLPFIPQPLRQQNKYATYTSVIKINNLHKKNTIKMKNAFKTNHYHQHQIKTSKQNYQTNIQKKYHQKIQNLMKSSHQKLQIIKKIHNQQHKKVDQNKIKKHKSLLSQTLQLRNKQINKLKDAQKRKQQSKSLFKSSFKPQINRLHFIKKLKQQEEQKSIALLEKSQQKIQIARQRRSRNNSFISQKSVRSLDDKIVHSRQYVRSVHQQSQITCLQYSISKQQRSDERLTQIGNKRKKINEQKRKSNNKKLNQAYKFKKEKQEKASRKFQQQLNRKVEKMQKVLQNKDTIISNYKAKLSQKMKQLKQSACYRFQKLHNTQLVHCTDLCEKEHDKWSFLTGLKAYENKTIEKNIHSNNKISLFR